MEQCDLHRAEVAKRIKVDLDVAFNSGRMCHLNGMGHNFIPKVTITRQENSNSQPWTKQFDYTRTRSITYPVCSAQCNSKL